MMYPQTSLLARCQQCPCISIYDAILSCCVKSGSSYVAIRLDKLAQARMLKISGSLPMYRSVRTAAAQVA